jgi:hypothetical protein
MKSKLFSLLHRGKPLLRQLASLLKNLWRNPIAVVLLLLLLALVVRPLFDPDFGWHIRAGIDFWHRGWVAYHDPYSWTMPDWHWVDHEWLADAILAPWYALFGPIGTSILYGVLITATFLLSASLRPTRIESKAAAALIGVIAGLVILGARQQMLTLLGLALILYMFYRYREGKLKHLWWMPVVFMVWANVHGGFTIGFLALGVIGIGEVVKIWLYQAHRLPLKHLAEPVMSWRQIRHCIIVVLLCVVATVFNPYGLNLHKDIYLTLTDNFALQSIVEWKPVRLTEPMGLNYLGYLVTLGAILLVAYRRIEPTRWLLLIVFLYLSLAHWRHMPFFMIISLGLIAELIDQYAGPILDRLRTLPIVLVLLVGLALPVLRERYYDTIRGASLEAQLGGTPLGALRWARAHPDQIGTKMYSLYGWGGFIVWQFPEQKVFIDGRMPYWKNSHWWPFYDHQMINQGGSQATVLLRSYGIDWMIIPVRQPLDLTLMGAQSEWKAVYNDGVAVIYTRRNILPNSPS